MKNYLCKIDFRHNKRKFVLLGALLICISIFAGSTLAYFTAEETAHNVITTGGLSMDLVEETTGGKPWPEEGIKGVTPGMVVDKIPYVVNTGDIDFYTRMSISMKVTASDGKTILSDKYISLDYNTEDWTEKDGFYYYNGAVESGKQTEPLFTKVTFDTKMNNAYMNATVEIDVHAQAVQSKNNGDGPMTATGWIAAE